MESNRNQMNFECELKDNQAMVREKDSMIDSMQQDLITLRTTSIICKRESTDAKANLTEAINNLSSLEFTRSKNSNLLNKKLSNIETNSIKFKKAKVNEKKEHLVYNMKIVYSNKICKIS